MDVFQPPPLYPPLVSRPLNLESNESYENRLKIKSNFRNLIQDSFYFIETKLIRDKNNSFDTTIERYSDRFSKAKKSDISQFNPDWSRFPKELKYFYENEQKTKILKKRKKVQPNLVKRKVKRINDDDEIDKLVEKIAKEEEEENEEGEEVEEKETKKETASDEEEKDEEVEGDEEEFEEENDYIDAYFDNGENYDDDELGGDDEGPVY